MGGIVKDPKLQVSLTACGVILVGVLYVAAYGLIHDGSTGQAILTWFESLLVPVFALGTVSTGIGQVADVIKSRITANAPAQPPTPAPTGGNQ